MLYEIYEYHDNAHHCSFLSFLISVSDHYFWAGPQDNLDTICWRSAILSSLVYYIIHEANTIAVGNRYDFMLVVSYAIHHTLTLISEFVIFHLFQHHYYYCHILYWKVWFCLVSTSMSQSSVLGKGPGMLNIIAKCGMVNLPEYVMRVHGIEIALGGSGW